MLFTKLLLLLASLTFVQLRDDPQPAPERTCLRVTHEGDGYVARVVPCSPES